MHPALLVSELLSNIFLHLKDLEACSLLESHKRSLVRCATTCRAWTEPALEIIWDNLDSLLPLLRLFPTDAFSNSNSTPTYWRFKRALRPCDWTAFTRYSSLVHHLSFREGRDVVASALVALVIQRPARFQSSPLIPNLVSLRWTASVDTTLTFCAIVVPPSLSCLTISLVGAKAHSVERNETVGGFLCTVVDLAPGLKELHLHVDKLWAVSDVVIPISTLSNLETLTLDVGSIGAYILRGLCQHPTLRKLVLDLCDVEETFLTHLLAHRAAKVTDEFPMLEEMILLAEIGIIDMTLSSLVKAPLLRLAISTFTLAHTDSLAQCFMHIAHNSPHLLSLTLITSLLDSTIHQSLRMAHLSPLAALRDLEVLSIELGFPVLLDDAEVISFVQALPRLTTLVLGPAPEWAHEGWRPKATIRCLEWISRYAKRIVYLGIALDLSVESFHGPVERQGSLEPVEKVGTALKTPPYYEHYENRQEMNVDHGSMERVQPAEAQLRILFVGASYPRLGKANEISAQLTTLFPLLHTLRHSNAPRKYSGAGPVWSAEYVHEWTRIAADVSGQRWEDEDEEENGYRLDEEERTYWDDDDVEMAIMEDGVEADEYEWRLAGGIPA